MPPNITSLEKQLGANVLEWWGLQINNERLSINMGRLQIIGRDKKILLHDLYTGMCSSELVNNIRIIGFDNFNFKKFVKQTDLYTDLVNVYIAIIKKITKEEYATRKFWFDYKRFGVRHTWGKSAPILKAMSCIFSATVHSPEFFAEESRFMTYKNFPLKNEAFQRKLSQAGLYYFGNSDYVQCFCCGGCINNWTTNENPFVRHAVVFSYCTLVQEHNTLCESDDISTKHTAEIEQVSINSEVEEIKPVEKTKKPTFLPRLKDDLQGNYHDFEHRYATFDSFKQISGRHDFDDSKLRCYADAGFYY